MAWKFFNSSGQEIVSDTVADGSITFAKMAANSINSDQYVDGSIDGVHIANDVIDSQHYAAASIDNEHLADDAVGADELAANAVVNASIASGAAVEFSKMENLTASRLLVSDGSGDVSVSSVTTTNLTDLTDAGATTLHSHAASAVSVKVGEFTRDSATASGTQAITGVGFQPKAVIFTGSKSGTLQVVYVAFTDGTNDGQTYSRELETSGSRVTNGGLFQFHQSGSGNYNSGGLTLDSDGFTISWTKAGTNSGTITIEYLAIR
jgi:hypothetical protein